MLARQVSCVRGWAAALVTAPGRPSLSQPAGLRNKAFHTLRMGNRTTQREVRTVSRLPNSQFTASMTISAANPQPDSKMLKVQWEGGTEDVYPYLWLRDNCQCGTCFHSSSLSRRVMLKDLSLSLNSTDVKVSADGDHVMVHFTDGHVGSYTAQWLRERAFRESRHEPRYRQCRLKQEYWGSELQDNIPCSSFAELLKSDAALLTFLENLETLGLAVVSGVPTEKDQVHRLTSRIGRMQSTHYGETFDVENKIDPVNLAYTSSSLDLHTDQPYLEHKPSIQLLHCIKQFSGKGGDNLLCDGFGVAMKLRAANPEYYDALAHTMVDFMDEGIEEAKKFYVCWRAPVIELDAEGTIRNINFNQMVRDSQFRVSPETAAAWYTACLAYRDLLYDANNMVKLKLQAGDLLVFDNLRVMHGREGYLAEGERILQGCYWPWDSVRSLRRVLHKELRGGLS